MAFVPCVAIAAAAGGHGHGGGGGPGPGHHAGGAHEEHRGGAHSPVQSFTRERTDLHGGEVRWLGHHVCHVWRPTLAPPRWLAVATTPCRWCAPVRLPLGARARQTHAQMDARKRTQDDMQAALQEQIDAKKAQKKARGSCTSTHTHHAQPNPLPRAKTHPPRDNESLGSRCRGRRRPGGRPLPPPPTHIHPAPHRPYPLASHPPLCACGLLGLP